MSDINDKEYGPPSDAGHRVSLRIPSSMWVRVLQYMHSLQQGNDIDLDRITSAAIRHLIDAGLFTKGL